MLVRTSVVLTSTCSATVLPKKSVEVITLNIVLTDRTTVALALPANRREVARIKKVSTASTIFKHKTEQQFLLVLGNANLFSVSDMTIFKIVVAFTRTAANVQTPLFNIN